MKRKRVLPLTSEFCKDPQPFSNLLASRHKFAPHYIDGVGCLASLVPARKSVDESNYEIYERNREKKNLKEFTEEPD
ncbi:hypothetical protein Pmani_034044 [Petrolisthes manimaculis]|uniref:Uncharacterized protein n=1 Tax=Petrolisthes manimaculis TaxID=1843537 RepID=A0AAE1NQ34_9EUCA|nr:hypothetical protein Pmani_034044 [Petrolisthes manimaculis]